MIDRPAGGGTLISETEATKSATLMVWSSQVAGTLWFFSLIMAALSWVLPAGVSTNAMKSVVERKKFEENLFWIGLNKGLSLEKLELL